MKTITCLAALMLSTGAMAAGNLSYTYVEVDYINNDLDIFGDPDLLVDDFDNGNGVALRGSFAFTPNFFVFGEYAFLSSDIRVIGPSEELLSSEADFDRYSVGVGINYPIVTDVEIIARAAYTDIEFDDVSFPEFDDENILEDNDASDGYFLDAAVRAQIVPWLEASGGVRYVDIEENDNFAFIGNLLFEITENWGVNAEVELGDEQSIFYVGGRYSFNRYD